MCGIQYDMRNMKTNDDLILRSSYLSLHELKLLKGDKRIRMILNPAFNMNVVDIMVIK